MSAHTNPGLLARMGNAAAGMAFDAANAVAGALDAAAAAEPRGQAHRNPAGVDPAALAKALEQKAARDAQRQAAAAAGGAERDQLVDDAAVSCLGRRGICEQLVIGSVRSASPLRLDGREAAQQRLPKHAMNAAMALFRQLIGGLNMWPFQGF